MPEGGSRDAVEGGNQVLQRFRAAARRILLASKMQWAN